VDLVKTAKAISTELEGSILHKKNTTHHNTPFMSKFISV